MSVIDLDLNRVLQHAADTPNRDTRVTTTTLLPGGGVATVSVRWAGTSYFVWDSGAALETLLSLGVNDFTRGDQRRAREIAELRGLAFQNGEFWLADVSGEQLPAAVAYVADASRALVEAVLEARHRRRERDLVERTSDLLRTMFPTAKLDAQRELVGASTKRHHFDFVLTTGDGRLAVFQTVSPAPTSLASTHLKLFDLAQASPEWPREAIADDLGSWSTDDLAIMQQVATHMRDFKRPWRDLGALLALPATPGSHTLPLPALPPPRLN